MISLLFQYKQDPSNSSIENDAAWCRFDSGEYSEHGFYITFFFSSYAIPMILIIFLYIAMLRRLWNPGSIGKQISKESLRNKKRVTRYFSTFTAFFFRGSSFPFGSGGLVGGCSTTDAYKVFQMKIYLLFMALCW